MIRFRVVMSKAGHVYAQSIVARTHSEAKWIAVDFNPGAFVISIGAIENSKEDVKR